MDLGRSEKFFIFRGFLILQLIKISPDNNSCILNITFELFKKIFLDNSLHLHLLCINNINNNTNCYKFGNRIFISLKMYELVHHFVI